MRHTKILSLLLCLTLVLTLLPGMAAYADGVSYLDENGVLQTQSPTPVSGPSWSSGWYVTNPGTTNIDSRITVSGDVHLILADGTTLNANAGITVEGNNTLTIEGTGTLNATGVGNDDDFIYPAGIGSYENDGGTVVINGGNITARGASGEYGGGAGIGGGLSYYVREEGFRGVNLTINGGNVEAIGGSSSPGIGDGQSYSGNNYSSVTINGGTVTAKGNENSAGIGGSMYSHGVNVTITGGTVTATGGTGAAGIGDGVSYSGQDDFTINVTGGHIIASGGDGDKDLDLTHGAGIGGGSDQAGHLKNRGNLDFSDNVKIYAGGKPNPETEWPFNDTPLGYGGDGFKNNHLYQYVILEGEPSDTPVESVTLDKTDAQTVTVGGNVAFTATVAPDDATDKTVKWSVGGTNANAVKLYSDANCSTEVGTDATDTLTVYAKGISAGSATVTVTSNADDTKTASCAVTVTPATISSVAVTGIDAPAAGQDLDTTAVSETANVTLSAVAFEPESEDGKASYATVYTAAVVATAAENYAFADNTSATVNGNTAAVTKNQDGTLTISYTFEKTALHPVEIGTSDAEKTYSPDGIDIPVNGMFEIPDGAGTATYSVSNVTGEGTYNAETGKLAVTKCGTFTVSVNTAATDTHSAGAATAALTIKKAYFTPVVTIEGWTRGDAANTPNITGNPGSGAVTYTYKAKGAEDSAYSATVPSAAGEYTVKADIAATENYNAASATADFTIAEKAFGTADFTLPADIRTVEDNAFEGAAMKIVYVPDTCTAIGAGAFKNCQGLQQIRLPKDCAVSDSAFEGCGTVWVFAYSGGTTETWCQGKQNIVFVSLGELS